ncbi:Uncharacterized protein PBTT_09364 [Plasmodiophora brassicae]
MARSTTWRIVALSTPATFAWDISVLRLVDANGYDVIESQAAIGIMSSGSAADEGYPGYDAWGAFCTKVFASGRCRDRNATHLMWGGRAGPDQQRWIGAVFDNPVTIQAVVLGQPLGRHHVHVVAVQHFSDSSWRTAAIACDVHPGTTAIISVLSVNNRDARQCSLHCFRDP